MMTLIALGILVSYFYSVVIAIPIAAGALYPSLGVLLRPEWSALAMSASTVTVTINALLLNRVRFGNEASGTT